MEIASRQGAKKRIKTLRLCALARDLVRTCLHEANMEKKMMSEPTRESTITLQEITRENAREIIRLKVSEVQEQFVASNVISLAQAYFERDHAWFRAIYADETPVGFVMLYDDPREPVYFLWRFMIDERYQGLGYGRKALNLLIQHVKTRPAATEIKVSYVPKDGNPGPFYAKLGFTETGEVEGDEKVMKLTLTYENDDSPKPPLGKPLTHIVMVKLKDPTPENIDEAVEKIRSMEGKIDVLKSLEVGRDIVRSERSYDLALIAKFEDRAGLEIYNTHPVHQPILAYLRERMSTATAVDFES